MSLAGLRIALVATTLTLVAGCASSNAAAPAAEPSTAGPTATSAPPSSGSSAPGWAPTTPNPTQWAVDAPVSGVAPASVQIPAIGVSSDLLNLAVDGATGQLVPPDRFDVAGWFTGGPVPGDLGPSIIAGHVDSRSGPGVFLRLGQLEVGQKIMVTRVDGTVLTFRVRAVDTWPKAEFPTDEVYGPTPDRELRLITCGGDFDRDIGHYRDNVVVFAVLER